jgi:GNAT superfamily N-acetyltransferase
VEADWVYYAGRPGIIEYTTGLATKGFPSVCLYDVNDAPMGYEFQQFYGVMGSLYVKEKHRRRGYGLVVTSQLSRLVMNAGETAYAHISTANQASVELHKKAGFQTACEVTCLVYTPAVNGKYKIHVSNVSCTNTNNTI